jgi:hypothetical protein
VICLPVDRLELVFVVELSDYYLHLPPYRLPIEDFYRVLILLVRWRLPKRRDRFISAIRQVFTVYET